MKGMKLIVNNEVKTEEPEKEMRVVREATPDDMDAVAQFADWLTQFPIDNIIGMNCLLLDILETSIDGFNATEIASVIAGAVKDIHEVHGSIGDNLK